MKKKSLVFKFTDTGKEVLFEDKLFIIEDKKLIENLEKPSIKNSESKLVIKSLNDTHVSDVIQVKVNMSETGYFLVSFAKDSLSEEKRKLLLEEIGKLKSNSAISNTTQLKKAKQLVEILNKYKPIYSIFINDGEYKINTAKLCLEEFNFPLLVLKKPEKKFVVHPKTKKEKTNKKNNKPVKTYQSFSLFDADYVFVLLFSLLCSFGTITSIFEFKNSQNIWIFLGILALAFAFVLVLSVQSTCYKKGKLINPFLRYYLILFILLGVAGGIVGGYFVSKLVLKTENADFDYKKLIILSSIISGVVCLSSLTTSRIANLVVKKRLAKKK